MKANVNLSRRWSLRLFTLDHRKRGRRRRKSMKRTRKAAMTEEELVGKRSEEGRGGDEREQKEKEMRRRKDVGGFQKFSTDQRQCHTHTFFFFFFFFFLFFLPTVNNYHIWPDLPDVLAPVSTNTRHLLDLFI